MTDIPKDRTDLIGSLAYAIQDGDSSPEYNGYIPWERALEMAENVLFAIEEMGCTVALKEPTEQMINHTAASSMHRGGIEPREKRDIYLWMLKASPFTQDGKKE